jgi:hypothetical protein
MGACVWMRLAGWHAGSVHACTVLSRPLVQGGCLIGKSYSNIGELYTILWTLELGTSAIQRGIQCTLPYLKGISIG